MTTPTLAQFAEALAAVKARHPQAPWLPDGYYFQDLRGIGTVLYFHLPPASTDLVARHAALALCVVTAMDRMGPWWIKRGHVFRIYFEAGIGWKWLVTIKDGSWRCGDADSLPSACLAALVAMGEGGGA